MGLRQWAKNRQKNARKRMMKTPQGRQALENIAKNKKEQKDKIVKQHEPGAKPGHFRKKRINKVKDLYSYFKPKLYKQDGELHLIELWSVEPMYNSSALNIEDYYTDQLNSFIDSMRKDGYKILKINTTSRPFINSHTSEIANGSNVYNTEIQYK